MKKFFLIPLFCAAIAFADDTCINLCTSCTEATDDAMCGKVNEICSCQNILDSINAAQEAHSKAINDSKQKLIADMDESCKKKICTRTVYFEDGVYARMEKTKGLINKENQLALISTNEDDNQVEPPAPLSSECSNLCGNCPIDENALEADSVSFENPLCQKIESSCGCFAFAKQNLLLAKQTEKDSIAKIEKALAKIENSKILADTLQHACDTVGSCAVQVSIQRLSYGIIAMRNMEIIDSTQEVDSTMIVAADSIKQDTISQDTIKTEASIIGIKDTTYPTQNVDVQRSKKDRIFYLGVNLFGGYIIEDGERAFGDLVEWISNGMDLGLGLVARWYLYKWGSIQTGLNVTYRYMDEIDFEDEGEIRYTDYSSYFYSNAYKRYYTYAYLYYHNVTLEFPVNLRLGYGMDNGTSIFASGTFLIRKPIAEWDYYSYDTNSYDDDDEWNWDYFTTEDWEFQFYLGFGFQIMRGFSMQMQWVLWNEQTGHGHLLYTDNGQNDCPDGFRITADFIF